MDGYGFTALHIETSCFRNTAQVQKTISIFPLKTIVGKRFNGGAIGSVYNIFWRLTWGSSTCSPPEVNYLPYLPNSSCRESHPRDISWKFIIIDNALSRLHSGGASKGFLAARVFSWGANSDGKLGHGLSSDPNEHSFRTPTEIKMLSTEGIVELACGGYSMWALTSKGIVYGWGRGITISALV